MKIKTKLPFDINQLQKIQQNGAIVELSDINFQHISKEKQIETALIYIQNTKTNVEFIFSQNSFLAKQQFLIKYISFNYIINSDQFIDTWLSILFYLENKYNIFDNCILSHDEILLFLNNNKQMCQNLLNVILSLPYFYLKAVQKNIYNSIPIQKNVFFNKNIIGFLKYEQIIDLFNTDLSKYKPLDYIKIFNEYNIQLFEAINNNQLVGCILYGFIYNKQLINKMFNLS